MDCKTNALVGQACRTLSFKIGYSEDKLRNIVLHFRDNYSKRKEIDKKGKRRLIFSPSKDLKKLQRTILAYISRRTSLPETFHGYKKKRSNLTNARLHLNKRVITKLDIKDFFPSVHFKRVFTLFKGLGFNEQESKILSRLTTVDYFLPQGFSASPFIASLMLRNLDKRLKTLFLAQRLNFTYTFFSDDITISGNGGIKNLKKLICKIFRQEGFSINRDKIKELPYWKSQEVTGIIVNEKFNVPYIYRHDLRAIIHNCISLGPRTQITRFNAELASNKKTVTNLSEFRERLFGKINYIKPINRNLYSQLLSSFGKIDWHSNKSVGVVEQ